MDDDWADLLALWWIWMDQQAGLKRQWVHEHFQVADGAASSQGMGVKRVMGRPLRRRK